MQFTERFLYHIWDAQHVLEKLQTVSGKDVQVLFPGRWNTDSGPDFKDAIIKIDNIVKRGDVEIELETYNWKLHEHHENPAFNSVILQLVFQHKGHNDFSINENGERIEILELKEYLNQDIKKLAKKYSEKTKKTIPKKCKLIDKMNSHEFENFLLKNGMERFKKKVKRFTAEHYFADFDQLLYQGLFESLGYSKNKFQMLQLANNIPYKKLQEYFASGKLTKDYLIAMLLCSSDLINSLPKTFPSGLKNKWIEIYSRENFYIEPLKISWQLFRLRPANHPANRILQISNVIYESLNSSLFKEIIKRFSFTLEQFKLSELKKNIYVHFQSTPDFLPEKYKLGKARIDTIMINIILPLMMVYAQEKKFAELNKKIKYVYQEYTKLPSNFVTTFMADFLSPEFKKILQKKAIYQQGILKLYYDKCKYHNCDDCV